MNSFAGILLDVINLQNEIAQEINEEPLQLKIIEKNQSLINHCKNIIKSEMGEQSPLITFLDYGFVIHHSDLPNRVKIAIEDLVKKNAVKLIIATTTIAHGVNLPIKNVLIKGLYQDKNKTLDNMQFWNICGRAGRAGIENEGQALFLIDKTEIRTDLKFKKPEIIQADRMKHNAKLRIIKEITDNLNVSNSISSIYILLSQIIGLWEEIYPDKDLNMLYELLVNDSFKWATTNEEGIVFWINKLDIYLLSLSEESEEEILSIGDIQEIIKASLFYISINQSDNDFINLETISEILRSRLVFIYTKFSTPDVRKRIYKLGMSLSTCELVENRIEELITLVDEGYYWDEFSNTEKITYLINISSFVLKLKDVFEDFYIPDHWEDILKLWLDGQNTSVILDIDGIFTKDTGELSLFLEKFCGYRIPWGMGSLLNYLKIYYDEHNDEMPRITLYLTNMIKYGITDPKAICMMPFLNQRKDLCLILSKICYFSYEILRTLSFG